MNKFSRNFGKDSGKLRGSHIIVMGNQASGTSAIASLLADFVGLSKVIDIPPLWNVQEIIKGNVKFEDIVGTYYDSYFSKGLIKEPCMAFFPEKVIKVFPKSKFVFVIRDPRGNIRSTLGRRDVPGNLKELDINAVATSTQNKMFLIGELNPRIWGIRIGREENYVGVLAYKWNKSVDNYLRHRDQMILVRYEDFLKDRCGYIANLAGKLGLKKKNDIKGRVNIQYTRRPFGKHSDVSWEKFFGSENLARINRICGSRMKKFGYKL